MREKDLDNPYTGKTTKELEIVIDVIRRANAAGLLAEVVLVLTRAESGTTEEKLVNIVKDWHL